jgi:F-type H+-transporting ATPase subunit a
MEGYILKRKAISYILGGLFFLVLVSAQTARQTEPSHKEAATVQYDEQAEHADHAAEEGFSPSDFVFDHILDAYDWHILSYDDFHLSIPLPVIIYSDTKGLNVFMFNRFHHGHEDYKGFRFETHGENKGNIVEILDDGSTALPMLDLSFSKNVLAIMFSLILLLWVFLSVAKAYSRRPDKAPTGMQNLLEPIILFIRDDIARPSIGEHKYEKFTDPHFSGRCQCNGQYFSDHGTGIVYLCDHHDQREPELLAAYF